MGRTIIKYAGQKEESKAKGAYSLEKKSVMTESEALQQVLSENAEVVDQRFLEKYFSDSTAQLDAKEAKRCAAIYSSLQGDDSELNSKNTVYENWNC